MTWVTLCPVCGASPRVGDGPNGPLADHPVRFRPWEGTRGPTCPASGLTITEAREVKPLP